MAKRLNKGPEICARIEALAAIGWTQRKIAERLGFAPAAFCNHEEYKKAYKIGISHKTDEVYKAMHEMATSGENFSATKWWIGTFGGTRMRARELGKTPHEMSSNIIAQIEEGEMSLEDGRHMMNIVKTHSDIMEVDEIRRRLEELEEKIMSSSEEKTGE